MDRPGHGRWLGAQGRGWWWRGIGAFARRGCLLDASDARAQHLHVPLHLHCAPSLPLPGVPPAGAGLPPHRVLPRSAGRRGGRAGGGRLGRPAATHVRGPTGAHALAQQGVGAGGALLGRGQGRGRWQNGRAYFDRRGARSPPRLATSPPPILPAAALCRTSVSRCTCWTAPWCCRIPVQRRSGGTLSCSGVGGVG